MAATLISLTGAPGSGKSTVARMLAAALAAELIEEDYSGNPFLAESYSGADQLHIAAQSWFMLSRVNQLARSRWGGDEIIVADYAYSQDDLYARLLLDADEYSAYRSLADRLGDQVLPPAVVVLLDGSLELLQRRITARGRGYEKAFTADFLSSLAEGCRSSVRAAAGESIVLEVDIDRHDLLQPDQQLWLCEQVKVALKNCNRAS